MNQQNTLCRDDVGIVDKFNNCDITRIERELSGVKEKTLHNNRTTFICSLGGMDTNTFKP